MENGETKVGPNLKRATIISGIGMGLLLGLIMGLSVSEVVKVIMGALTALLGAFLGFDKKSFTGVSKEDYQKENETTAYTSLRAGYFGIAVAFGIIIGMWIRTKEVFTPSIVSAVKQYTDAGYSPEEARRYVIYQRLGINPKSGEAGPVTEIQRGHSSNLFSDVEIQNLCANTDPFQWRENWEEAKKALKSFKITSLTNLSESIEKNIKEKDRFDFLKSLNTLICNMKGKKTQFCELEDNLEAIEKEELTREIAAEIAKLAEPEKKDLLVATKAFLCELEK